MTALQLSIVAVASAAAPQVAVFPTPGSHLAAPSTQITFRGVPVSDFGTITVTGSRSGAHAGRIASDSDGLGGSFLPSKGFKPGEKVTVRTGLNVIGAVDGSFSFTVENPGGWIPPIPRTGAARVRGDVYKYRSRPDLQPAAVHINQTSSKTAPGDIFLTPMRGPVQWGPEIVDSSGKVVWFDPLPGTDEAADLRVQQYHGEPVLTWFRGYVNGGVGKGYDVIMNDHYQQITEVRAANGLNADLHEFDITPQGTAFITAYKLVHWDTSAAGGPKDTAVQDSVIQEIDIATGLVLFQWDSLDHIPVSNSYLPPPPHSHEPYDYFHINSVQQQPDGNLIVSARNTSAVYEINHLTGAVMWTLGGKHSSFKMGSGTDTAYQHHARLHAGGLMTIFDDGDAPMLHPQSRGLLERLNTTTHTVTLVQEFDHSPSIDTNVEGSVQLLPGGDVFVGWGSAPFFTEFTSHGKQIFDGRFVNAISSYRAYRFPWNGQPLTDPAIATDTLGNGTTNVYASWNGATGVASWRVLTGTSPSKLSPISGAGRNGFETGIGARTGDPYFAVEALGSAGQVLGTSSVKSVGPHIAVFGSSAYVDPTGVGELPAACYSPKPCRISTSLWDVTTRVAKTGPQTLAPNTAGLIRFRLGPTGQTRLRHGNLHVQVVTKAPGIWNSTPLTLVPYETSGAGPAREATAAPPLELAGTTDFVASNGGGAILAGCLSAIPCRASTTVSVGGTTIAQSPGQKIPAGQLAYLPISLTAAGQSLLAHARGNQLGATVAITDGTHTATGEIALVRAGT